MARYIPFDEMVESAYTLLDEQTRPSRPVIKQWLWGGVKGLKFNEHHVRTSAPIPAEELAIRKPTDMVSPIEVTLWGVDNRQFKYIYKKRGVYINEQSDLNSWIYLSENADSFLLNSNGSIVAFAIIKYYGWPITDDGEPLIPEDAEVPLQEFVYWRQAKRTKLGPTMQELAKQDWIKAKSEYNSRAKMPHPVAGKEIARTFGSMVQRQVKTVDGPPSVVDRNRRFL